MITANEKKNWTWAVAGIFWNSDERRFRMIWRLAGTVIVTVILTFVLGTPFFVAGGGFSAPYLEKFVLYMAALVAIILVTSILDRRPFADNGIFFKRAWWTGLGFGLLLGAFLMTIVFLVELAAGWVSVDDFLLVGNPGQPFLVAFLLPLSLNLVVGIVEELMFRGYLLRNLAEGLAGRLLNPRLALIAAWLLTSAGFGIAHAFLPNATALSTLNILLAGIWLGLAYVLTGSLAISIGIHITWNLLQGYVFGFPVSGARDFATSVIAIEQAGPDWWTGGAFGPEGGLLGLFGIISGILLVAAWVHRRYGRLTLHVRQK